MNRLVYKIIERTLTILSIYLFSLSITFANSIVPDQEWWTAIKNDQSSSIQTLLLHKVDTAAFNKIGNPALLQAAREQSWQVFDLLASTPGVDIDQANAYNETALMYLVIQGQTDRAVKLIQHGASVNRLGWTPLHYAASKAQLAAAEMLIDKGAIVNAPGPDGTTPLMMAALSGNEEIVRLLVSKGADATMHNAKGEDAADWARKKNNSTLADLLDQLAVKTSNQRLGIKEAPATVEPVTESSTAKYFDLDRFD